MFSPPPITREHPKPDAARRKPDRMGLIAAARLRGTAVTLAAAARSPGVTTAMTYEVRVGTSICESALRTNSRVTAAQRAGANGTSTKQTLAGKWVNTIVFTSPMRPEIQDAAKF